MIPFSNDQIIYEDNHLIAVNKRSGQIVQGDKTGDVTLLEQVKEYIKNKYKKPGAVYLNLIHRIDRPVTGVILFARTGKATERLNKAFHDREVQKTYLAIVDHRPKNIQGKLEHYILRDREKNCSKALPKMKGDAKKATLSYELLKKIGKTYMLEIKPLTGRHHQIRAQLAAIGCHIIGDLKYGYSKPNDDKSICLHAHHLELIHPVKKEKMIIRASVPTLDMWRKFK